MSDPYEWIDPFEVAEQLEAAKRDKPRIFKDGYNKALHEFGAYPSDFAEGAIRSMMRLMGTSWGEQEGLRIARSVAEKCEARVQSKPEDMTITLSVHHQQPWSYAIAIDPYSLRLR